LRKKLRIIKDRLQGLKFLWAKRFVFHHVSFVPKFLGMALRCAIRVDPEIHRWDVPPYREMLVDDFQNQLSGRASIVGRMPLDRLFLIKAARTLLLGTPFFSIPNRTTTRTVYLLESEITWRS
jgi:hypothetical protein